VLPLPGRGQMWPESAHSIVIPAFVSCPHFPADMLTNNYSPESLPQTVSNRTGRCDRASPSRFCRAQGANCAVHSVVPENGLGQPLASQWISERRLLSAMRAASRVEYRGEEGEGGQIPSIARRQQIRTANIRTTQPTGEATGCTGDTVPQGGC
jgi:hypothetical protein